MAHYPQIVAQINSQVIELSKTCGLPMWTNSGKPGDDRWTTWENSAGVYTQPTGPVHKKGAANWENFGIHSPYYYYVPITQ